MAYALQRQLILPNAAGPHYSVCFSLPIHTELETSVLGANTSTWDAFLRYAERRALLRHPLSARAVILGNNAGGDPLSDVVDASIPLSSLREWPCLRPAGLALRKQDPPVLVRPGMAAKTRSPAGLTAHRDLVYSTLSAIPASTIVLFWPLEEPIYDLPPLVMPAPMIGRADSRLDWGDKVRTTMRELGTVMILLWDTDASSTDSFCLDAAAEAIGDHPDTDAILGPFGRSRRPKLTVPVWTPSDEPLELSLIPALRGKLLPPVHTMAEMAALTFGRATGQHEPELCVRAAPG